MRKRKKTFDEVFKNKIKQFFEPLAIVKTEFEILKLPRKVDILIIEADKPIQDSVLLFTYFKKFNILEFKSESDNFRIIDLYKLGHYINGILLTERHANTENTTFTLVSTNKPGWLFKDFEFTEIKKGLYVTSEISIIKVYVVLTEEIETVFEKEYGFLNIFSGQKRREKILTDLLETANDIDLEDLFILYEEEIRELLRKGGHSMTVIQERVKELADKYGISQDERNIGKKEGLALADLKAKKAARKEKLKTAINMKNKHFEIELIASITELEKNYLIRLFKKLNLPSTL